ncbi:MAG: hypothetical protein ACPIOQ_74775, partial [Promethearchaeia archaeon]
HSQLHPHQDSGKKPEETRSQFEGSVGRHPASKVALPVMMGTKSPWPPRTCCLVPPAAGAGGARVKSETCRRQSESCRRHTQTNVGDTATSLRKWRCDRRWPTGVVEVV